MPLDLVLEGGTVATASETFHCDVGIAAGKILTLGTRLGDAGRRIDARGKLVLSGGIDSHVHIAQAYEPGIVMGDDFASGTMSSLMGWATPPSLPSACRRKAKSYTKP